MEVSWGNGGYVKDIRSVCRMVGWGETGFRWERGVGGTWLLSIQYRPVNGSKSVES